MTPARQQELRSLYQEKAEAAAKIEQLGNYAQAADLWNLAGKYALTIEQKEWCRHRADYCENWQGKRERRNA